MDKKNLGLPSVIATSVGLIVATSCLLSIGQGAFEIGITFIISMAIACIFNMLFALSVSEMNALMPNLTGGLAQYTLAAMGPFVTIVIMVGGYLACNTMTSCAECAMFGNTLSEVFSQLGIPASVYCVILVVILMAINLRGIDMFAKIQNVVAYGLIGSLIILGVMGTLKMAPGEVVVQPKVLSAQFTEVTGLCGLAFFLFIGCEYVIPIAQNVKKARRNVPMGMLISLLLIFIMQVLMVFGFSNYTPWDLLGDSTTPHVLYGTLLLGSVGTYWMAVISILAVVSSLNTAIASLSYIASGMAKIGLLPEIFMYTNKKGAPYVGILTFGGIILLVNAFGLSGSDKLSFLILTGCVFWMAAYLITHINVLIFRKRLPKAPRTFKVPGGPILPLIGSGGIVWMIWNISGDMATRLMIYGVCLIILAVLVIYAVFWIKVVMRRKLFKPYPLEEVMSMEHELYPVYHKNKNGKNVLENNC